MDLAFAIGRYELGRPQTKLVPSIEPTNMPITFWAGQPRSQTSHEGLARNKLMQLFSARFASGERPIFALFDVYCGADLDLAIFAPDAIIVVELKECAAPIAGSENGRWQILNDSSAPAELKGGRFGNPFQQIKQYRYQLMEFLGQNKNRFLSEQKAALVRFDHVSGVLAISPTLNGQSKIDISSFPWFHLTGLDSLADRVEAITSNRFSFSEEELRRLVCEVLHCGAVFPAEPSPDTQTGTTIGSQESTLLRLAEGGDLNATFELGCFYFCTGIPENEKKAAAWFQKAASNGHHRAQGMLGMLYENGRGVEQSYPMALFYYRQGAAGGDGIAQNQLANLYANGAGGPAKGFQKGVRTVSSSGTAGSSQCSKRPWRQLYLGKGG